MHLYLHADNVPWRRKLAQRAEWIIKARRITLVTSNHLLLLLLSVVSHTDLAELRT